MSKEQLLRNPIDPRDYDRGRAGAIVPDDLDPHRLYTVRLLLSQEAKGPNNVGVKAVEGLVEVMAAPEDDGLVSIRHVSDDGEPEDPTYTPVVSEDGILYGSAAPMRSNEGYLLNSTSSLEDELQGIEEEVSVPVRSRPIDATSAQRYMTVPPSEE